MEGSMLAWQCPGGRVQDPYEGGEGASSDGRVHLRVHMGWQGTE